MRTVVLTCLWTASLGLTVLFMGVRANGAELWVDRDSLGGECSDERSREQVTAQTPWCTLGMTGEGLEPGDIVTVRAGTYGEVHLCSSCNDNAVLQVINAGTPEAPIKYRAAPGEKVIVTGADGTPNGIQIRRTFDGRQPEWIEVEGFEIRDFPLDECISVRSANDITLRDLNVHNCDVAAVELHRTERTVLEGSFIHDNGLSAFTSAVDLFECGQDNIIRGNFIWRNTDEHRNETEGHGIIVDVCPQDAQAIIENNVIWENEGWCIVVYQTAGVTIRNNTCYHNGFGRSPDGGELVVLGDRQKLHNNVLVPDDGKLALNIRERSNFRIDFAATEADGNLIWSPTHDVVVGWSTGTRATVAEYRDTNPFGWGATAVFADPLFIAPETTDFRVQSESPAIDTAVAEAAAATDLLGSVRPADPDRGAYEIPAAKTGLEGLGGGAADPCSSSAKLAVDDDANGDGIPDECQCGDPNGTGAYESEDLLQIFQCLTEDPQAKNEPCATRILRGDTNFSHTPASFESADLLNVFTRVEGSQPGWSLTCPARPIGLDPSAP